jgi:deoxyribonuclease-1
MAIALVQLSGLAIVAVVCLCGCQQPAQTDESTFSSTTASTGGKTPRGPSKPLSRNSTQDSFKKAKRAMMAVYAGHEQTFYCGCSYSQRKVDHQSCGYVPKTDNKRARSVEWEHVVPAHAFGRSFDEWRQGHPKCVNRKGKPFEGRNCARKVNREFRYMEADMYNLVPAIGEVNQLRSNFSFAELAGEPREFGACDVEIGGRKIEPRPSIRGDIARIYMYMDAAYPRRGIISNKSRKLFESWAAEDRVDRWECERARTIERVQGNRNQVVMTACMALNP